MEKREASGTENYARAKESQRQEGMFQAEVWNRRCGRDRPERVRRDNGKRGGGSRIDRGCPSGGAEEFVLRNRLPTAASATLRASAQEKANGFPKFPKIDMLSSLKGRNGVKERSRRSE